MISASLSSSGSLTVRNTTGNPGNGIHMFHSELHLEGGAIVIENNKTDSVVGHGINAAKSRVAILGANPAKITGNKGHGIGLFQNSDGLITGFEIQNNGLSGVTADGASVLDMIGASVSGNTVMDVVLGFGSLGTFNNSNFAQDRLFCGPGTLVRGDRSCP